MPSVNIYALNKTNAQSIESILPGLKELQIKTKYALQLKIMSKNNVREQVLFSFGYNCLNWVQV